MSDDVQLTDEQIENWRRVMLTVIGPYAAILPREEIERMAKMMQGDMDQLSEVNDE